MSGAMKRKGSKELGVGGAHAPVAARGARAPRGFAFALALGALVTLAVAPRAAAQGGTPGGSGGSGGSTTLPPRDHYKSARAMGMGGASVAVADDGDAIFLNPAGIGREDGERTKNILRGAQFPNVTVGANKYSLGLYRAYRDAEEKSAAVERTILEARERDVVYGYASMFPYLTVMRFQMGLLASAWGEGYVTRHDAPRESAYSTEGKPLAYDRTITAYGMSQTGAVAGFSLPYKQTGFSLGVTGRYAVRTSFYRDVEASAETAREEGESYSSSLNATRGVGVDVGALWSFRSAGGPAVGLTLRDVGDTRYRPVRATDHAEIERMNLGAGVSLRPELAKEVALLFAADVQRINDGRLPLRDKVKMGFELGVGSLLGARAPFSLRAGHNLRAPSFGVGVDLLFVKIDASWLGEPVPGPSGTRVDTRGLVKASIDLRT